MSIVTSQTCVVFKGKCDNEAVCKHLSEIAKVFVKTGRIDDEDLNFARQHRVRELNGWYLKQDANTKIYSSYVL